MPLPRRSLKPEATISTLLLFGVFIVWFCFFLFLNHISAERAAFWFMRSHLSLGENPSFVLRIAEQGIPQPTTILITWQEFQISLLFAGLFLVGLTWLTFRLWKAGRLIIEEKRTNETARSI